MNRIPKVLHYCFGLDRYFGGKPWSLVHYVCVKSAIERIKPDQTFIYYEYEPDGVWWELTRKLLTPVKIRAPRSIFGNPLLHPAHRADVVRLETLIRHGGIYLDCDVIVHDKFDHLLDNSVVLGAERADPTDTLGNAVMLSEPNASFLKRWHAEYRWFRSDGVKYWAEHSTGLPPVLFKSYPNEATVLPRTEFYWPLFIPEGYDLIYGSPGRPEVRGTLANHLCESYAWKKYLRNLTPKKVRSIDSNFHRWARPFVEDLPDDYGRLSAGEACKRFLQVQQWRIASRAVRWTSNISRAKRN